jgi:iron(III) transport system permease protein
MPLRWLQRFFLLLILFMLCVPVLAVMGSWLQWDAVTADILQQMGSTVLPDYAWTTLRLCLMVALGTVVIGSASAAAVTLFEFPGRRVAEWALLLPLAMPAYVVAYAYTDFLQFSGPLQTGVRAVFGLEGRVFPEVRSLGGAAWVFTFSLYPYVYLLARTALGERATHLMEAARLLGAPMSRRIREVALPLARPAIAAGAALALMETLADFGVSSYFGIQTFSAGIYKAWLAMDNRIAAAQLATVLLVVVMVLLNLEHRAQKRMRFSSVRGARAGAVEAQAAPLAGIRLAAVWVVCTVPVLLGFVLPVIFMLRPLAADWSVLPWTGFVAWSYNSVRLGLVTALVAVAMALLLAFSARRESGRFTRAVVQLAGLGYAIPGAVIVVGLLLPVGWLQAAAPDTRIRLCHDGDRVRPGLGLSGALLCGGPAVGAERVCAHPGQFRRLRPHAGHGRIRADAPRALAAAQAFHRSRGASGVRGCDEGAARHPGAAPFQQRHAGRGGLPARARRAPGRSRAAVAGAGAGGPDPGDPAQPHPAAGQPALKCCSRRCAAPEYAYIRNHKTNLFGNPASMAKSKAVVDTSPITESDEVFELAAELFRVMSAPMRLRIISSLCNGEKNVGELLREIDTTQPNMSQHLHTLYQSGVLGKRREGVQIFYRIINDNVVTLCRAVCTQIAIEGDPRSIGASLKTGK